MKVSLHDIGQSNRLLKEIDVKINELNDATNGFGSELEELTGNDDGNILSPILKVVKQQQELFQHIIKIFSKGGND